MTKAKREEVMKAEREEVTTAAGQKEVTKAKRKRRGLYSFLRVSGRLPSATP